MVVTASAGAFAVVVMLLHVAATLVSAVLHEGGVVWLAAGVFGGHGGTVRTFGLVLDPLRWVLVLDRGGGCDRGLAWRLRRWLWRGERCLPRVPLWDLWRAFLVRVSAMRSPAGRGVRGKGLRLVCRLREGVSEEDEPLGGVLITLWPLLANVGLLLGNLGDVGALATLAGFTAAACAG